MCVCVTDAVLHRLTPLIHPYTLVILLYSPLSFLFSTFVSSHFSLIFSSLFCFWSMFPYPIHHSPLLDFLHHSYSLLNSLHCSSLSYHLFILLPPTLSFCFSLLAIRFVILLFHTSSILPQSFLFPLPLHHSSLNVLRHTSLSFHSIIFLSVLVIIFLSPLVSLPFHSSTVISAVGAIVSA